MRTIEEILRAVAPLPPRERAAALMHYVYMLTAERVAWNKRVATDWRSLDAAARDFNLASADTWLREPELYEAWCQAIEQLRQGEPARGE